MQRTHLIIHAPTDSIVNCGRGLHAGTDLFLARRGKQEDVLSAS